MSLTNISPLIPTPTPLLADGMYRIENVKYPTQHAGLISPGGQTGIVGGFQYNNHSQGVLWNLTNVASDPGVVRNQVTVKIAGTLMWASVLEQLVNQTVFGEPNVPMVWSLKPITQGQYQITLPDAPLAWSLSNETDETPIMLQGPASDQSQSWKFVPQK